MRACHRGVVVGMAMIGAVFSDPPVHAQGSTNSALRRVFIEATAMADYDQTDFEPPGPALADGAGIGARLARRYTLRFEFDKPGEHVELFEAPRLRHRFASKTTAFAFLLGRDFRIDKRVPIVVLIGVSALTHRTHFTGYIDFAAPDANGSRHVDFDEHDVEQWVAVTLGVEAPIAISRHLRVVPQLRTHDVANEELGQRSALRPRLSLRWQF